MNGASNAGNGGESAAQSADALIQHYRIGKTLGAGSFGKVKLAEHKLTGHKVAIKIMKRKKIQGAGLDEKVQREIKISSQLHHPHIIKIYETMETSEDIYVILEYAQSGELFDYITERGKLPEHEAKAFFQQLISGIECCHKKMVTHRDIKPENILLDKCNRIKIADFGLSNAMREGHFLKTSCGSPQYAAPEIVSGKLYGGPEVDVWSCGVVLFAMLCGSLPFDDENIPRLFKKIRSGVFSFPTTAHVDPRARDLIKRMLNKDQLERITIDDIWKHPWFKRDLPPYLLALRTERAAALSFDSAALDKCVAWNFDRHAVVADLRGRRMTPATVTYHLCTNSANPCGQYEQTDARGVDDAARAMEALRGPGGEGDTNVHLADNPSMFSLHGELNRGGGREQPPQKRWRVGVRDNRLVRHVVTDLKHALQSIGAAWKLGPVPYNFKCRVSLPTAAWAAGLAVTASNTGKLPPEAAAAVGNGMTNGTNGTKGTNGTMNGATNGATNGHYGHAAAPSHMMMTPRTPRTPHSPHSPHSVVMDYMDADTGPLILTPRSPAGNGPTPLPPLTAGQLTPNGKHRAMHALGTRPGWHVVKFEVQIYKLRPGCYVIDMQRLEGHVYHYLDLCGELATILLHLSARAQAASGHTFRMN